jgi:hypothetical protein
VKTVLDKERLQPELQPSTSVRALSLADESACRPGSVTRLPVTWQYSPECWLTYGLTSRGFSSVPGSFHALAELGRNWRVPGRRWRSQPGQYVGVRHARGFSLCWSSAGIRSGVVDLDVFDAQGGFVAAAASLRRCVLTVGLLVVTLNNQVSPKHRWG